MLACPMQRQDEKMVALLAGVSQSGPALKQALQERNAMHGLTVLGSVVAWGYVRIAEMLVLACRRAVPSMRAAKLLNCAALPSKFGL